MGRELRVDPRHREANPRLQVGRRLQERAAADLIDQVAPFDVLEHAIGREQQRVPRRHRDGSADLDAHVAGADAVREQVALVVVVGFGGLEHSGCDTVSDRRVRDRLEAHAPALAHEQRSGIPGVIGARRSVADLDHHERRARADALLEELRVRVLEGIEDGRAQCVALFSLGVAVGDTIGRPHDGPLDRAPDRADRRRGRLGPGRQTADPVGDREHRHRPGQLAEERRVLVARRLVERLRAEEHGLPPLGRQTLGALVIELEEDLGHRRGATRGGCVEVGRSALLRPGAILADPVRSGVQSRAGGSG